MKNLKQLINEAVTKPIKLKSSKSIQARIFDFRSDTVTRPLLLSPSLQQTIANASTEDDVLQIDPSTTHLEQQIARLTGKQAALFCCSGTMSNQLGLRVHLRGALQTVLLDSRSHIYKYENAGLAYHAQAACLPLNPLLTSHQRYIDADLIRQYLQLDKNEVHCGQTRVISLENTLNGSIMPVDEIKRISQLASDNGIIMHLDGARLWNASAETGISLEDYCKYFDSISLCLSKGIGAPIGSVLVGSNELIREARHFRKLFGGGWRQSGFLADIAYESMKTTFLEVDANGNSQLKRDHINAKWLSKQLEESIPGLKVVNEVETNMIFIDIRRIKNNQLTKVNQLIKAFETVSERDLESKSTDVKCILPSYGYSYDRGNGGNKDDDYVMRLVLHYQVPREACEVLVSQLKRAVELL